MVHEILRSAKCEGAPRRLDIARPCFQHPLALQLLIDPLQRGAENLLALLWFLGRARETPSTRISLASQAESMAWATPSMA